MRLGSILTAEYHSFCKVLVMEMSQQERKSFFNLSMQQWKHVFLKLAINVWLLGCLLAKVRFLRNRLSLTMNYLRWASANEYYDIQMNTMTGNIRLENRTKKKKYINIMLLLSDNILALQLWWSHDYSVRCCCSDKEIIFDFE